MMKITVGIALTLIGTSLPGVFSWGGSGHQIVGMVAQNYLTPKAAAAISSILDATYSGSLGPAATWADAVKHTKGYTWSAPLHFADTNDSPPDSCGYGRKNGLIRRGAFCEIRFVRFLMIMSSLLQWIPVIAHLKVAWFPPSRLCNPTNSNAVKDEALKFITHFLGDITQPLHVCARDLGGNKDKATFDGKTTLNLHSVWYVILIHEISNKLSGMLDIIHSYMTNTYHNRDTSIIEKHMTNDYSGSLANYVQGLIKSIDSGEFKSLKDQWSSCVDPTAVGTTGTGNLNCAIVWAQDTNGYDCGSEVWKNFLSDTTADLGGSYYKAAVPIVDQQLAKGTLISALSPTLQILPND
ncbi:phospholipase C/P1 nuclease domain-containing protein [Jimgerdemannia flammicorona]|uniref:Phospholipase C/P1 nuclease domain-containing protein n=1 Tax=Jimgerdemannia flammicorona TaxID=994334 RepID=A0A433QG51_9FUNG|nr:phospholipase C/P1 nuclease domain-containing protein [Jimgerdemannia flammicorona]